MRRRAYGGTRVNHVDVAKLLHGKESLGVSVGIAVGKHMLLAVCRWDDGSFERPWRVHNPSALPDLVKLLQHVGGERTLAVAMGSSGTYGDALRQARAEAGLERQRVGTKAAHDYAEVFAGVPSQHDGKDAAVVAELAALGESTLGSYQPADAWGQELAHGVEWMVAHRQVVALGQGRREGLLGRHWPEATRVLKLTSAALLKVSCPYGSPQALAADPEAGTRLRRWGGTLPDARTSERLAADAGASRGVRAGDGEKRPIQDYAQQALRARPRGRRGEGRLRALARGHGVPEAHGQVIGIPTAWVLWVSTGDPRQYHAAAAYRKATGLNLVGRSRGAYQGALRISKRGSARWRQWLYVAVLRLVQKAGVRPWYEAKKARDPHAAKSVVVASMRQLALALYPVAVHNREFDARRLFARIPAGVPTAKESSGKRVAQA